MREVQAQFTGLSYSGYGVGKTPGGKVVYAWNAYPGETAKVTLFSDKKEPYKGTAIEILRPSKYRIPPRESHFLISSPWQTVSYEREIIWKQQIIANLWREIIGTEQPPSKLVYDNYFYHYRNSIEFNIVQQGSGLSLGLMKRGRKHVVPVAGSALAYECINTAALDIVSQLTQNRCVATDIKRLVIRANRTQEMTAILYVTNPLFAKNCQLVLRGKLKSIQIYYSDPNTAQLDSTQLLLSYGDPVLAELVCGAILRYSATDFFQPNIPLFERAVQRMREYVQGHEVVDFYSGVGSIGIALGKDIPKGFLVERDVHATEWARKNIAEQGYTHLHAVAASTQDALEYMTHDRVVILDPPREGLHQSVVDRLKEVQPRRIVYLSCKPYTQLRDIKQLLDVYKVTFTELYNFFPRTPHIESLIVLDRV